MAEVLFVRARESREFQNPSSATVMQITYECHSGRCEANSRVWQINWPILDDVTLEQAPTCVACGSTLRTVHREEVERGVR